jgi:hypothetical protein
MAGVSELRAEDSTLGASASTEERADRVRLEGLPILAALSGSKRFAL